MARPVLYSAIFSPPSCAVRIVAKAIGLDLDVKSVNLMKGEHLTEEYKKINPLRTVPVLDDNGFILRDSHAIMTYLIDKYAEDHQLYPKDLQRRATINQYLHFETGVLFAHLLTISKPIFMRETNKISSNAHNLLNQAYYFMDTVLEGKKWLAGDNYTLADISCVTTLGSVTVFTPIDDYSNLTKWFQNCKKELPEFKEIAEIGMNGFHGLIKSRL